MTQDFSCTKAATNNLQTTHVAEASLVDNVLSECRTAQDEWDSEA